GPARDQVLRSLRDREARSGLHARLGAASVGLGARPRASAGRSDEGLLLTAPRPDVDEGVRSACRRPTLCQAYPLIARRTITDTLGAVCSMTLRARDIEWVTTGLSELQLRERPKAGSKRGSP